MFCPVCGANPIPYPIEEWELHRLPEDIRFWLMRKVGMEKVYMCVGCSSLDSLDEAKVRDALEWERLDAEAHAKMPTAWDHLLGEDAGLTPKRRAPLGEEESL